MKKMILLISLLLTSCSTKYIIPQNALPSDSNSFSARSEGALVKMYDACDLTKGIKTMSSGYIVNKEQGIIQTAAHAHGKCREMIAVRARISGFEIY